MKTSSWFAYSGPGRISTSRGTPRGAAAGYRVFRALAPGPWFNSVDPATYYRRYRQEILGVLDPRRTWDELHRLAGAHEPVLLCFEKPGGPQWCHRALISEWFLEQLGEHVPELGQDQSLTGRAHPLFLPRLRDLDPPPLR